MIIFVNLSVAIILNGVKKVVGTKKKNNDSMVYSLLFLGFMLSVGWFKSKFVRFILTLVNLRFLF